MICVCAGVLVKGKPPPVGLCVDDFTHFSASNATEKAFEAKLGVEVIVNFTDLMTFFLGCLHTWDTLADHSVTPVTFPKQQRSNPSLESLACLIPTGLASVPLALTLIKFQRMTSILLTSVI